MGDQALLQDYCRTGSDEAFAALVRRYVDLVYSAARRQVVDPGLAEDVTQAVFVLLSKKATSLRADVVLSSWLLTAANLCARDAIKRRARRQKHEARAAHMPDAPQPPESAAEWNELAPVIDHAVASLPRRYREALTLRFWEGKSHREIAQTIGISENASAKRMTRALEKLRVKLLRSDAIKASGLSILSLPAVLAGGNIIQSAPEHLITAAVSAAKSAAPASAAIAKGAMYIMAVSKVQAAAIGIGAAVLLVGVSIPVIKTMTANTPAQSPAATPRSLAALPPTTTRSSNAVDSYTEAIKLVEVLQNTRDDATRLGQYADGQFDADTDAFFGRYGLIVSWVRLGAASPSCDWEGSGLNGRIPALTNLRGTSRVVTAHARFAIAQQQTAVAVDDLLTNMAFARHLGTGQALISKLVELAIETGSIETMAGILPSLSKDQLKTLPQRLDNLPKSSTGKQMIEAEHAAALKTAREQGNYVQIAALGSMDEFYRVLGDAMDQPPEAFNKIEDEQLTKLPSSTVPGMLAKVLVPSLKRSRMTMAVVQAKREMLRTAVDIVSNGESAAANSRDPFGSGPFTYVKTANGFELSSQLVDPAKPENGRIKLSVGGR